MFYVRLYYLYAYIFYSTEENTYFILLRTSFSVADFSVNEVWCSPYFTTHRLSHCNFLMTSRHQNGSLNPRPRQLWRFACTENMRADMLLINESIRNSWQMMKRYRPHNKSKGVPGTSVSRQVLRQTYYKTWSYWSKSCFFNSNRMGAWRGNGDLYTPYICKDKIWKTAKRLSLFIYLDSSKLLYSTFGFFVLQLNV